MVQETFEIQIIPAILGRSLEDVHEQLSRVSRLVPLVQIDVCDGKLTPEATWPYNKHGEVDFENFLTEDDGLPFWESVNFEIDLMTKKPEDEIEKWVRAGASRIIVHFESTDPDKLGEIIATLRQSDVEVGISLDVLTPLDVLEPLEEYIDSVQLMGIDRDGFQGQPFDEVVLDRVRQVREKFPFMHIAVDGGVSLETATDILDAGADRLVVGSALFESYDIEETLREFQML
ncbi:MAG: hypothetical protein WCI52_03650 [bacterium]